ncbi:MAG: ATP-binding protein [Polyangiaceae bacterium]
MAPSHEHADQSFRALIEGLPDAVIVHRDGIAIYANAAAHALHGFDRTGIIGRNVEQFIPPDELHIARERFDHAVRSGGRIPVREGHLVRNDGTVVDVEIHGLAVVFDGEPAVLSIAHDVTQKHQMMAQLAQRDRLASMGLLAASVAHEINNPITYVLLNLERLQKDLPQAASAFDDLFADLSAEIGEERATELFQRNRAARAQQTLEALTERATTAAEGARQVGRIARDLRAFARAEEDERGPVDVNALLDRVLDLAANELRFRATVVREYGDVPHVHANEGRLSQVFLNLIVNAAQSIEEGAPERNRVRIRTVAQAGDLRVTVSDTGSGIDPKSTGRLFDPFFTTKARGQGSGLGLSICRDIVQGHGGRIEVASEPGDGAHFTVVLPLGSGGDASAGPPPSVLPKIEEGRPRPRVLVIDDERTLRSTIEALLQDTYDVVLAGSGAEAFDLLATDRRFDVVLCDLMMPEISGMAVHAWVQREAPDLSSRMVFMTGGAFTRAASEFLEQVMNRYIEKPFEVHDLMSVLDRVVRKGVSARPGLAPLP